MLTEIAVVGDMAQQGFAAADMAVSALDYERRAWSEQTNFGESAPVLAALDFARSVSGLFILLAVVSSLLFVCYGSLLLMASGGEARKMERARGVLKHTGVGLTVSVCSYLIISGAITLGFRVVGMPETVTFWEDTVFEDDFGFYSLLSDGTENLALEGEVVMLVGGTPIVCDLDVGSTTNNAWSYKDDIIDAIGDPGVGPGPGHASDKVRGCVKN